MDTLKAILGPQPLVELAVLLGIVYLLGLAIRTPASESSSEPTGRARARCAPGRGPAPAPDHQTRSEEIDEVNNVNEESTWTR